MVLLRPRLFAWLALSVLAGCSLTTSLSGFSNGGDEGLNADGSATASSEGGTTAESGAPGDAAMSDGGTPPGIDAATYSFTDDFNRPDDLMGLGNGWREKRRAFALYGGAAVRFVPGSGGDDYRDNLASRPDGEAVRDVDVSMKFTFMAAGGGWVQIHARVQTSTLATPNALDSYLFFRNMDVGDDRTFTIARQHGFATWVGLAELKTSVALQPGAPYRMRLVVKGTTPVELEGTIEAMSQGSWTKIGSASAADADPTRIQTAGVVGISSGNDPSGTYSVDDFQARGL